MRRSLTLLSTLLILTAALRAADEPNANEARLREAVRTLTARVQTAESERAIAQASLADLEAKNKQLTDKVAALIKHADSDKAGFEKETAAADAKLAERDADLARTTEALEKWKTGHAQVTELGKKAEAARAALAAKATTLGNRVADLERKNLALFKIGNEVITRLENFSYGTALAAREPFIGATRVKLENQVQGYRDKILDPSLKP